MTEKIKNKELVENSIIASVHYGDVPKSWNSKMSPYILHEKYGHHIFDLVKTSKLLKLAGNVLQKKAEKGGKFLFVGTSKISSSIIARQAIRSNSFYINYRWLGGMLTNWTTIQKKITRLKYLEGQKKIGVLEFLSKKEYSSKKKEIYKLQRLFCGIKEMKFLPDAVIFTNQKKDLLAIQECLRLGITTISIVDSNSNPDLIPYPIPGNDDSSSSINHILSHLANRISQGYKVFLAHKKTNRNSYIYTPH